MLKHLAVYVSILLTLSACHSKSQNKIDYPRMIGDIEFDAQIDTSNFELCNSEKMAVQYYAYTKHTGNKPYANEKHEIDQLFRNSYDSEKVKKQSGLVRIRFMVNCKGEAGRYRILGMNKMYQKIEFDLSITDQLLSITKRIPKWNPFYTETLIRDYYMYLIFKIEQGKLVEILP